MIALIQRVSRAQVTVKGEVVASASRGILTLIGIAATDSTRTGDRLLERVLGYRIFPDEAGKMNLNVRDIDGDLLLVPQFTLLAETDKGTRPGFSAGASPDQARASYEQLVATARTLYPKVSSGIFGADMQVELVNDGPATFWLETK